MLLACRHGSSCQCVWIHRVAVAIHGCFIVVHGDSGLVHIWVTFGSHWATGLGAISHVATTMDVVVVLLLLLAIVFLLRRHCGQGGPRPDASWGAALVVESSQVLWPGPVGGGSMPGEGDGDHAVLPLLGLGLPAPPSARGVRTQQLGSEDGRRPHPLLPHRGLQ